MGLHFLLLMSELDNLKQKIKDLESHLRHNSKLHEKEINRIKLENYEALEASQTRYQAELEIQKTNFQREIAKLKTKLSSFEV